ncbi:hypothetical protein GBAR_LOCUS31249 [Geodia barretti]|uniref:Uncharacterized protein n=1 Tax=Geodia barretti TaxID=519541 RepID=A0AA35XFX2_GEOBA|nr:hypothetical protein GBAR_LOCUS31249 [Geodia barretti]
MSLAGVYFILFLAVLAGVHSESWTEETCDSKYEECEDLMSAPDPLDEEERCYRYNQTIRCFDVYFEENCIGQALLATFARNRTIKTKYCPDCSSEPLGDCIGSFFTPVSTPSPSVTTPPPGCSYSPPLHLFPPFTSPPLPELGSPSLSHLPLSTECSLPTHETHYKQHCSIFSLSHLRPFSDRSLPLQTCVLYGSVYLIKHKNMSVSVSGAFKTGTVGYYTDITEVMRLT